MHDIGGGRWCTIISSGLQLRPSYWAYGKPFSVMYSNPQYNAEYVDYVVKNKWLNILEERESYKQLSLFDYFYCDGK